MTNKPFNTPKVLLSRDGTPISKAIQWFTDGKASHAMLYFPNREKPIWEAVPGGVRFREVESWKGVEAYDVQRVDWGEVEWFAKAIEGDGYDYFNFVRFFLRSAGKRTDRYVCSGAVFDALQCGGVKLLERVPFWRVSPENLRRSPLLIPAMWPENFEH